jgi:hypothetical protein
MLLLYPGELYRLLGASSIFVILACYYGKHLFHVNISFFTGGFNREDKTIDLVYCGCFNREDKTIDLVYCGCFVNVLLISLI